MPAQEAGVDRVVWLLRHAKTADIAPGRRDLDRPLTERGHRQAAEVGAFLRGQAPIDRVLCSPAQRTRETFAGLALDAPIEIVDALYDAGGEDIRMELSALDDAVGSVLVIGHAPGVPGLAGMLADPDRSDRAALRSLDRGFSPASLARIDVTGSWADLTDGALTLVRPSDA